MCAQKIIIILTDFEPFSSKYSYMYFMTLLFLLVSKFTTKYVLLKTQSINMYNKRNGHYNNNILVLLLFLKCYLFFLSYSLNINTKTKVTLTKQSNSSFLLCLLSTEFVVHLEPSHTSHISYSAFICTFFLPSL